MSPAVLQDGRELQVRRIGLLGDPAHGLFHWGSGACRYPNIESVSAHPAAHQELRQLLIEGSSLTFPVADEHRFTTDYVPQLRQKSLSARLTGRSRCPNISRRC